MTADLAASLPTVIALALATMAAGFAAGVLAGFLGVGGGIILVPALFHAFGFAGVDEAVRMHMAVGTSLATIIPTSIRSLSKHHAKGAVDFALLRQWALPMIVGVLTGTLAAAWISGPVLTLIFVTLALGVGVQMILGREDWRLGDTLPGEPVRSGFAAGTGFFSALMGIGGGSFGVTLMTLYGWPIHRAIGTSSGLGLIISVPGAIGFVLTGLGTEGRAPLSLGYVNLVGLALVVPMTMLAVPIGVAAAHRLSRATLRRAFAVFLGIMAATMLVETVAQ